MAAVHIGRIVGPYNFSKTVAVKRLHPAFAKDRSWIEGLIDEARITASIHNPSVVPTLDLIVDDEEVLILLEYIHGESLSRLLQVCKERQVKIPLPIASSIAAGILRGLHSAHKSRDTQGKYLNIVHRDVSPSNILVGIDGIARLLDFGIAKAFGRLQVTTEPVVKGKLAYMSPEQMKALSIDGRSDIWSMGVVLWEMLAGRRLFDANTDGELMAQVLNAKVPELTKSVTTESSAFDKIIAKAVRQNPKARYVDALAMAEEVEQCCTAASPGEVGRWVETMVGKSLMEREKLIVNLANRQPVLVLPRQTSCSTSEPTKKRRVDNRTLIAATIIAVMALLVSAIIAIVYPRNTTMNISTSSSSLKNGKVSPPENKAVSNHNEIGDSKRLSVENQRPLVIDPVVIPISSSYPSNESQKSQASNSLPKVILSKNKSKSRASAAKPVKHDESPCKIPYSIDSNGHKRFKLNCL
jgi:serine/threonine-protein kinase